jgi:hypothetical protein
MGTSIHGINMWRAGCGGSRTSGSEGGQENPTSRKADRALLSDPYTYCRTWAGFVYVSFIIDVSATLDRGMARHDNSSNRTRDGSFTHGAMESQA